jgi:hypothetical protein
MGSGGISASGRDDNAVLVTGDDNRGLTLLESGSRSSLVLFMSFYYTKVFPLTRTCEKTCANNVRIYCLSFTIMADSCTGSNEATNF